MCTQSVTIFNTSDDAILILVHIQSLQYNKGDKYENIIKPIYIAFDYPWVKPSG